MAARRMAVASCAWWWPAATGRLTRRASIPPALRLPPVPRAVAAQTSARWRRPRPLEGRAWVLPLAPAAPAPAAARLQLQLPLVAAAAAGWAKAAAKAAQQAQQPIRSGPRAARHAAWRRPPARIVAREARTARRDGYMHAGGRAPAPMHPARHLPACPRPCAASSQRSVSVCCAGLCSMAHAPWSCAPCGMPASAAHLRLDRVQVLLELEVLPTRGVRVGQLAARARAGRRNRWDVRAVRGGRLLRLRLLRHGCSLISSWWRRRQRRRRRRSSRAAQAVGLCGGARLHARLQERS
jgi:hypothetical protein